MCVVIIEGPTRNECYLRKSIKINENQVPTRFSGKNQKDAQIRIDLRDRNKNFEQLVLKGAVFETNDEAANDQ